LGTRLQVLCAEHRTQSPGGRLPTFHFLPDTPSSPLHDGMDDLDKKRKNVPAMLLTHNARPIRYKIEYRNCKRFRNMLPRRNGQSSAQCTAAKCKRTGRRTRKRKVPGNELGNALGFRQAGESDSYADFAVFPLFLSFGNRFPGLQLDFGLK
jgi:hypothetical protein